MKTSNKCLALLLGLLLVSGGCSDEGDGPAVAPNGEPLVTVVGEVTAIDNQIPVDGGIKIDLQLDEGGAALLLFPSLFTDPPPSEETMRLYEIVASVEVGDRVEAEGKETERGIKLEALTILPR